MARKQKHEDHINHEAWAIPYGDLITLLLAFFVVMYSISSINEGKYRVLSDALSHAFGGPPKSIKPVQMGVKQQRGSESEGKLTVLQTQTIEQSIGGTTRDLKNPPVMPSLRPLPTVHQRQPSGATGYERQKAELERISDAVEKAMGELIERELIIVRKTELWLEIEIRTDILFPSGVARLSPEALPVLQRLAEILQPFPHALRIEGHTDNRPISTVAFPSNWELSAARAASVVHLFMKSGVEPTRMSVAGLGEFHPVAGNDTVEGRNRNRRVVLVVMADNAAPDRRVETEPTADALGAPQAPTAPADTPAAGEGSGSRAPLTVYVPPGTLDLLQSGG